MITEQDERRGLVKVYWADIRKRVAKVEPTFTKIVDELNPDKTFPIYLAYYPYGVLKGDTESTFFPKVTEGTYRLTDADSPKELIKHLGYSKDGAPIGMVLEKNLELFIDLKDQSISIPRTIYSPGSFFPFSKILRKKNNRIYMPNSVLSTASGVRSTFMLPNIGCIIHHTNLQRDFNIKNPPPKSLYEHWRIFQEIVNSNVINSDWRSCVIYFSEKWLNKLYLNDKAWLPLKLYLHELAWSHHEYRRNHIYYDIAFSVMQKKRNLKPNPYLADIAQHLFAIALGDAPGYTPTIDEEALPLEVLQKVFIESYGLKKYLPTILRPIHFNFEQDSMPVYYSLKNSSTHVFSPKSRAVSSTLSEMRELEHIMRVFIEELKKDNSICSETILSQIAQQTEFKYFHNEHDRHHVVQSSSEIGKHDTRYDFATANNSRQLCFASDAPFVRGCVSIQSKKL